MLIHYVRCRVKKVCLFLFLECGKFCLKITLAKILLYNYLCQDLKTQLSFRAKHKKIYTSNNNNNMRDLDLKSTFFSEITGRDAPSDHPRISQWMLTNTFATKLLGLLNTYQLRKARDGL